MAAQIHETIIMLETNIMLEILFIGSGPRYWVRTISLQTVLTASGSYGLIHPF